MATLFRRSLTRAATSLRIPARGIAGADHPFVIRSPSPDIEVSDANFNDFITQVSLASLKMSQTNINIANHCAYCMKRNPHNLKIFLRTFTSMAIVRPSQLLSQTAAWMFVPSQTS